MRSSPSFEHINITAPFETKQTLAEYRSELECSISEENAMRELLSRNIESFGKDELFSLLECITQSKNARDALLHGISISGGHQSARLIKLLNPGDAFIALNAAEILSNGKISLGYSLDDIHYLALRVNNPGHAKILLEHPIIKESLSGYAKNYLISLLD